MKIAENIDSKNINFNYLDKINNTLLIIQNTKKTLKLTEWFAQNRDFLIQAITTYGGALLRGFDINGVSEFNQCVKSMSSNLLDYTFRSTPRSRLGGNIFTATEYPANRVIPMHNENAYTKNWPRYIFFFNVIEADEGGETPISDSRRVYNKIDLDIRHKFEDKKLLYVRNYHDSIDLSWQEVFQTEERDMVNAYCDRFGINYSWNSTGSILTTKELCQASLSHPITGEMIWFNQAHLFHPSSLPKGNYECLVVALGLEYLPRNVFYGDGTTIKPKDLKHILDVYESEKLTFRWQRGDLMVLDNMLLAHGREPFKGQRKVAVAMTGDF